MLFKATLRHARISPRKARLVVDRVRGRSVNEVLVELGMDGKTAEPMIFKRAVPMVRKLLHSAIANVRHYVEKPENRGMEIDEDHLYIQEARVDEGPRLKRFRPRSRGMASPIIKCTCHIHLVLEERKSAEEQVDKHPDKQAGAATTTAKAAGSVASVKKTAPRKDSGKNPASKRAGKE